MSDFVTSFLHDLNIDADSPEVQQDLRDHEVKAMLIEKLMRIRKDQKLSQKVVAERMETTQSRVSALERTAGNPRLDTLFSYASAVGANLSFVVSMAAPRGWDSAGHAVGDVKVGSARDALAGPAWELVLVSATA